MTRHAYPGQTNRRRGQIVLVVVFMLAALAILLFVNVDVFLAARSKNRLTDAGDAAALAAARWQGLTLNLIGELNLAHLDAACKYADDPAMSSNVCAGIAALQERLAFAGPLMGCYDANRAAHLNHVVEYADSRLILNDVLQRASYLPDTPTWPGKGGDYSLMLQAAFAEGAAMGVDNAKLYNLDFSGDHPLYNRDFYEAIEGEDWCWFFFRPDYLARLKSFSGWGELPPGEQVITQWNPEFFGCGVRPASGWTLAGAPDVDALLLDLAARFGLPNVNAATLDKGFHGTPDLFGTDARHGGAVEHRWWFYDADWRPWYEMDPTSDDRLPIVSEVRDEFNLFGASAAARVYAEIGAVTPDVATNLNWWTAAAKPFGRRETPYGVCPVTEYDPSFGVRPFPLVTPDFTDVRLIPLAGASERRLGTADLNWVVHTRDHVRSCVGGLTFGGCRYCAALKKWNDAEFRRKGVDWLAENSGTCHRPGGHSSQGGTRHAH